MNSNPLPPVLTRASSALPQGTRAAAGGSGDEPRPFVFSQALDEARRSAPPPPPSRESVGSPHSALGAPPMPTARAPAPAPAFASAPAPAVREEDNAAKRERLGPRAFESREGSAARSESAWNREPQGPRLADRARLAPAPADRPAPNAGPRPPAPAPSPTAPRPLRGAGGPADAAGATGRTREGQAQHRASRKAVSDTHEDEAYTEAADRRRAVGSDDTALADPSSTLSAGSGALEAGADRRRAPDPDVSTVDAAATLGARADASGALDGVTQGDSDRAAALQTRSAALAQGLSAPGTHGASAAATTVIDAASASHEARLQSALAATDDEAAGPSLASATSSNLLPPGALPGGVVTASLHAATAAPVTAPEATLQAHPGSAGFAHELGAQLSLFVREGVQQARLQLNPQDMGPVFVRIHLDGQAAQVHLAAEQGATRQALEHALPALAGHLSEAGITLTGGGVFERHAGGFGAEARTPAGDGSSRGNAAADGATGNEDASAQVDNTVQTEPGRWSRTRGIVDLIA